MPGRNLSKDTGHARPKVNRDFWWKINKYWRENEIRYKNGFTHCQLDLFREGARTARTTPAEFSRSQAEHDSYARPKQKTLQIPLEEKDNDLLVPFYTGVYDVKDRDAVACIILSIGCRSRGVI